MLTTLPDTAVRTARVDLAPDRPVSLQELTRVAEGRDTFRLSGEATQAMAASRTALALAIDSRKLIYGVTTGFGPLAGRYLPAARARELQRNLVYHLASGVGPPLSPLHTRAIMAARAVSLSRGYSAIRPKTVELLLDCLAIDLLPLIPSMGTVGASGDLTPLAHMALALMGEGEVLWRGGRTPAAAALARAGLTPLDPEHKECLALVNGTSAMTGIAAVNSVLAARAIELGLRLSVLYAELYAGRRSAYSPALAAVRPHPGQIEATRKLIALSAPSTRLRDEPDSAAPFSPPCETGPISSGELIQDPYTIRCAPQIFGAVLDVLRFHDRTVEIELNSVTDNPICPAEGEILHGGNFYGQHVAFAADALSNAVIKLAIHSERKIARITDEKLNAGLPPFLQANQPGLHSGFMGAQVTATAILAEMRTKAIPASIQSIPTNANNQDTVTMGTIAARKCAELLDHLWDLLAIECLVLTQAFELRCGFAPDYSPAKESGFAPATAALATRVRTLASFLREDRPLAEDIRRVSEAIREPDFITT